MILDAHIHMFRPDQMPSTGDDYLAKLPTYIRLLFTPTKYNHTRQGWATCERMIDIMDEEGIERVTVLGPEDDYTAECYNRFPDRLLPFKYLDMPALRKDRKAELRRMRRFIEDEGFVGFGEHHPDLRGNELYHPDVLAVMDLASELGVPVNLHVSEPVGHFYYGKSHNAAEEYLWLIERYPDVRFLFSHWGGGIAFYEAIPELRALLKNVTYDTTASRLFFDVRKSMEQITQIVEPRKILYGSDFPLLLHPDEYPDELDPRFIHDRCDFLQANLPAHILDGIMGRNYAAFLGLPDSPSADATTPPRKPAIARHPAPVPNERPFFVGTKVSAGSSVFLVARQYPQTRDIFARRGIQWEDARVPPWLPLVQPLAQSGVWFEDGFSDELRAALPADDARVRLPDLDLVHEGIRQLAKNHPPVRTLLDRTGVRATESCVPPWETIEQAAATRGLWPPDPLLDELNAAIA